MRRPDSPTTMTADAIDYAALFSDQQRFLWGLCYRMTGNAADADDLVQETFVRALDRPPARIDEPWRPWLVRVAMNLARDVLRRRRRSPYRGNWLPSPVETSAEDVPPAYEVPEGSGSPTEGRYELLESVSFAFLLALEALTPSQRAVLLLRDVFDYAVRETADALGMSEANVKVTHHRVMRLFFGLNRRLGGNLAVRIETFNGLPGLAIDFGRSGPRVAPRGVIRLDIGADDRITAVHAVLASRKLTAVRFSN